VTQDLRRRALERALQIVGGSPELAARLRVADYVLELWLQGRASMPASAFFEIVDVIIEDDLARASGDRRQQPRPPKDGVA
jgi:hypothetical protein